MRKMRDNPVDTIPAVLNRPLVTGMIPYMMILSLIPVRTHATNRPYADIPSDNGDKPALRRYHRLVCENVWTGCPPGRLTAPPPSDHMRTP